MTQFASPNAETAGSPIPPSDMADDGSAEFAQHTNISQLPTLNALPNNGRGGAAPTLWDGRTVNLPVQAALPKMGLQPAPPVNQ